MFVSLDILFLFFFKQKTAYELRISDWSSDVCSSDLFPAAAGRDAPAGYSRAPDQPVDQAYTDLIAKFTTDPALNSPLTDYLPASDTVPHPLDAFGRIAGAEGWLPYSADEHRYFRELEKASPRVRMYHIGGREEGPN